MESMFRQFKSSKDVPKSAILYFTVNSKSKTEVTRLGRPVRPFGEGGGLVRSIFEGAIVGFDRLGTNYHFESLDQ